MPTFAPSNISRYTLNDHRASSLVNLDSNTNCSYTTMFFFAYRLQYVRYALRARIRHTQYASSASAEVNFVRNARDLRS